MLTDFQQFFTESQQYIFNLVVVKDFAKLWKCRNTSSWNVRHLFWVTLNNAPVLSRRRVAGTCRAHRRQRAISTDSSMNYIEEKLAQVCRSVLLSGQTVRWSRRMLPAGESRWVCRRDGQTDRRTGRPLHYAFC